MGQILDVEPVVYNTGWIAVNTDLKYKIVDNLCVAEFTLKHTTSGSSTTWNTLGTLPYPPDKQLIGTVDGRTGTTAMWQINTNGAVSVYDEYASADRYASVCYAI